MDPLNNMDDDLKGLKGQMDTRQISSSSDLKRLAGYDDDELLKPDASPHVIDHDDGPLNQSKSGKHYRLDDTIRPKSRERRKRDRSSHQDSFVFDPRCTEVSRKLSSVLVIPNSVKIDREADSKARDEILDIQRKDKRVFDRNRRMFGLLMGTLKRFKTEEISREELTIKRSKIDMKVEKAAEVCNDEANLFEVGRARRGISLELTRIDDQSPIGNEFTLDVTEPFSNAESKLDAINRFKSWEISHRNSSGYIQTDSEPKILWLPKEHSQFTERKFKETRNLFDLRLAERTADFKREMDKLEAETSDARKHAKELEYSGSDSPD